MPTAFFFSYAHANRSSDGKLEQFFDELSSTVAQKMGTAVEDAGYMDRSGLTPGVQWSPALVSALQNSSVLVSLVSAHYTSSAYCGKELQVFLKRRAQHVQNNAGINPGIIIPVMWMNMPGRSWPTVLQPFQHAGELLPAPFTDRGVRSLMLSTDTAGYNLFLEQLADVIVAAARLQPTLQPLAEVIDFDDVEDAFAPITPVIASRSNSSGSKALASPAPPDVVRIFYVAAPQQEMDAAQSLEDNPPQRLRTSTANYGRRGYYWQPYHPTVTLPVGHIASGAVSGYEYKPGDPALAEGLLEEIREAKEEGEIAVVIVDPWILRIPAYRDLMTKLDEKFTETSCVIVPLNEDDVETCQAQKRLDAAVVVTFKRLRGNPNQFRYPVKSPDALAQTIKEMLTSVSLTVTEQLAAQIELSGPPLPILSNSSGGMR